MKNIKSIFSIAIVGLIGLSSCATGGFDENPRLDQLNAELAKAPSVESISANGTIVERNTVSIREIDAMVGDDLNIVAALTSGENAQLAELEFYRQYYGRVFSQEAPRPVVDGTDGFNTLSGTTADFQHTYTVPAVDDDGFDFHEGNIITLYFRVRNSNDFYGFKELVIHIVE